MSNLLLSLAFGACVGLSAYYSEADEMTRMIWWMGAAVYFRTIDN